MAANAKGFKLVCIFVKPNEPHMAKNYFNRYVWLIDTINRNGYISRDQINRLWRNSRLNETGEELYERTFHNHREAILEIFGIEIKCDRSLGYYIANSDELEENGMRKWLMESLSINNLLNETRDMRDRIIFEKIPSSQKWLPVIVNAMRDGKAVEITYQSFNYEEPSSFPICPYCLKLFKQRWYVLGKCEKYDYPRVYALDERMSNARQLEEKSIVPKGFDAKEFFQNSFGIIIGNDRAPVTIGIKVVKNQVKYIESLPLHHSQKKIEDTPDYNVYEFFLAPTFDFEQEILSHGPDYEVLYPEEFRDVIKADVAQMYKNYGL